MNWTELLKAEIQSTYAVADALVAMAEDSRLDWKPSPQNNWMTTGQLLMHLTQSCGAAFKGFVTGDWGLPDGVNMAEIPPEEMLPPAEKLPAIRNVAEARRLLLEDKRLALEILAGCKEERLDRDPAPAPWDPTPTVLGHRLLQMIDHLKQHKGQLFYYLKLQGKPVSTGSLWGM